MRDILRLRNRILGVIGPWAAVGIACQPGAVPPPLADAVEETNDSNGIVGPDASDGSGLTDAGALDAADSLTDTWPDADKEIPARWRRGQRTRERRAGWQALSTRHVVQVGLF